jgi:fibronectin type 3 domain-containing protein
MKLLLRLLTLLTAIVTVSCSGGDGGGGGSTPIITNPSTTLQWSTPVVYIDNTPVTVSGYKIYYGTESGNYTSVLNVGNVNSFTVQNLTANTTYYFVVTAYDADGVESDPTDEQSKTL